MCEALIDLAGPLADEPDRLGLNTVMKIQEVITNTKPAMTPDQARIEGLKAQVKRSQAAVKAERAAAVMTLVNSARLNGHDRYAYMKDVLQRLPTQKLSAIVELLPDRWQPAG